jgi:hypothetical protein
MPIPHNFHPDLVTTALSPDVFQLLTLSAVSAYRLVDWFAVRIFSRRNAAPAVVTSGEAHGANR